MQPRCGKEQSGIADREQPAGNWALAFGQRDFDPTLMEGAVA